MRCIEKRVITTTQYLGARGYLFPTEKAARVSFTEEALRLVFVNKVDGFYGTLPGSEKHLQLTRFISGLIENKEQILKILSEEV